MAEDDRIFPRKAEVRSYVFFGSPDGGSAEPPPERTLDGLEHIADPGVSDWLMLELTTFAQSAASIIPGRFAAYARVEHPSAAEWGRVGNLPCALMDPLIGHLAAATATPHECYFALWEGFAGTIPYKKSEPTLFLPHRAYHVFRGDISAVRTSFQQHFGDQSANLWWPADHAWCVATEVDLTWTYIGGPQLCIDAILADKRFESMRIADVRALWRRSSDKDK